MNRIESAVGRSIGEITPLDLDTAAVPVATPWAAVGVTLGAAALGYQVGYHLGGSLEDDLDDLPADAASAPLSSVELLAQRTRIVTR